MPSKKSSSSGTRKVKKGKQYDPVSEVGQIPFALCEVIALAESGNQPEIAVLAESMLDLVLSCRSLEVLVLPQAAKDEIAAVIAKYQKGSEQ
jgi:hypothetical protein